MSEETWTLEKDLCRCCHAEGTFKNLGEQCLDSDLEEIYADMLRYCFDIDLLAVPGLLCAVTYTICEICISHLQEAYKFKKNVEVCEEKFKDLYHRNLIKVNKPKLEPDIEVKQEAIDSCPEDDFSLEDDDLITIPDDSCGKKVLETKTESKEKVTKKMKKQQIKSKTVKTKMKKKINRTKDIKNELIEEGDMNKKKVVQPIFRLTDGDYKIDGTTLVCTRCEKRYEKMNSLRFHVKMKHYKIPRFICSYCKKAFLTPAPLTVHKMEAHNIDERFKCNACKGAFNTKVQLKKHINNFHMLGEKYSCEFCEYESYSFESMYKHKFKHKTSKDHHCKFCKKSFLRKTTLDLHERIHTGDRRKICNICGQAFVQKASLNYHMTKYHPEVNF